MNLLCALLVIESRLTPCCIHKAFLFKIVTLKNIEKKNLGNFLPLKALFIFYKKKTEQHEIDRLLIFNPFAKFTSLTNLFWKISDLKYIFFTSVLAFGNPANLWSSFFTLRPLNHLHHLSTHCGHNSFFVYFLEKL